MLRSLSQRLSGSSGRSNFHDILPTASGRHGLTKRRRDSQPCFTRFYTKRILRLLVFVVLCVGAVHFFWSADGAVETIVAEIHSKPPLYEKYYEAELRQHTPDSPYPEGKHGKFIWYANHVHGSGWGNAMQEHLLNLHLAHESGRAYVYNNYTWNKDGSDYTDFNGHLIPSRIPISALLQGPAAGGHWPPGDTAPRAIPKHYWKEVCPESEKIASDSLFKLDAEEDGGVILKAWVDKLATMSRCVEIDEQSAQIWSIWMFGSKRVLGVWDSLKKSPIMTQFRWSKLIEDGFLANYRLFTSSSWFASLFPLRNAHPYTTIPGLLALHIRRGDFENHCLHFARWSSQWNGFNQFPELPDHFEPPPSAGWGEYTEEGKNIYLRHCFPTVQQIVDRVAEVRATPAGKGLKNIFIMTNGKRDWVAELKGELDKLGGWDKIASSRDMTLSWEQQYVAQSVDMLIGQRAQVLIGNGFSSLTSNIVMLRMAQDISADTNRFW